MSTGFPIRATSWNPFIVCSRYLWNWQTKLNGGLQIRRWLHSAIERFWMSLTVYDAMPMRESHWLSDTAKLQCFYRFDEPPVYVGAVGDGKSEAFYCLGDMAHWFMEMGLPMDDPIWDFIDQLATDELEDASECE